MMKITRGNPSIGAVVEIAFGEPMELLVKNGDDIEPLVVRPCQRCASIVVNADDHADFHYALAAGRPFGDGPPPGFRS